MVTCPTSSARRALKSVGTTDFARWNILRFWFALLVGVVTLHGNTRKREKCDVAVSEPTKTLKKLLWCKMAMKHGHIWILKRENIQGRCISIRREDTLISKTEHLSETCICLCETSETWPSKMNTAFGKHPQHQLSAPDRFTQV